MNQPTTDFPVFRNSQVGGHAFDQLKNTQIHLVKAQRTGGPRAELYLLVPDPALPCFTAAAGHFGRLQLNGLVQRVSVAVGERTGAFKIRSGDTRQSDDMASGWTQLKYRSTVEKFVRKREYTGRVRDIDSERGTFTAVLGKRIDDPESETLATFELGLLNSKQSARLTTGSVFTLVTGYRQTVHESGKVLKATLATRVFLQEPRRLSPSRRKASDDFADELFEDE